MQLMRYRQAILSFIADPLKTKYCPGECSPATAAIDLRALFFDMFMFPAKYQDEHSESYIKFDVEAQRSVSQSYVFKYDDDGVYMSRRTRRIRTSFAPRNRETVLAKVSAARVNPAAESANGLQLPVSKKLALRNVDNPRAVLIACRAAQFQMFDAPIEMDGVMTEEQLETYSSKFPDLEFLTRENTTLIL